jgi:hypothetical protein
MIRLVSSFSKYGSRRCGPVPLAIRQCKRPVAEKPEAPSPLVAAQIGVATPEVSAKRIPISTPRNPVLFGPHKPLPHVKRRLHGSPDT